MAIAELSDLDQYNGREEFPPSWDELDWCRAFFSPVDNVAGALHAMLDSADRSLFVCMYSLTSDDLINVMLNKLTDENVFVQLTLDQSCYDQAKERGLLASFPASSVAIGVSEKGSLIHEKVAVIDSTDLITGSTNWTYDGETQEDNDLLVIRDPTVVAYYAARLAALHLYVQKEAHDGPSQGNPNPATA